jgi:hypothetical protein
LDLDDYLESLKKIAKEQTNDLLKFQTTEYLQYINQLIELGDIMTKKFYVVIQYNALTSKKKSFFSRVGDMILPTTLLELSQHEFEKRKDDMMVAINKIASGLGAMDLRATVLDTQSLIELYYNVYNPAVSRREKMADNSKLRLEENNTI